METKNAKPKKLRNGDWGALVEGTASVADFLTVTTKAGKSWTSVVTKVLWTGNGVSICATEKAVLPEPKKEAFRHDGSIAGMFRAKVAEWLSAEPNEDELYVMSVVANSLAGRCPDGCCGPGADGPPSPGSEEADAVTQPIITAKRAARYAA